MSNFLPLLFCDDDIAVVDKPSGMLVHRGWDRDPVVAMTALRDQLGRRVFPVHRLDRATSGVLIFALSSETANLLQRQFEEGRIQKRYLALVRGAPEDCVVDHPVPRSEDGPRVPAVTEIHRLASGNGFSLVLAEPRTGRFHQIRRHLKHISHPIVGDVNYGRGEINRLFRDKYGLKRLALHAWTISFAHPRNGSLLKISAAPPNELISALNAIGIPDESWIENQ